MLIVYCGLIKARLSLTMIAASLQMEGTLKDSTERGTGEQKEDDGGRE